MTTPSLRLYRHLPRRDSAAASALAIGNFDGVHRGHQAILARVRDHAQQHGLRAGVMVFAPTPELGLPGAPSAPS